MCIFPLVGKRDIFASCTLLALIAAAAPAPANEPPAFTPFSPASASKPGPFIHSDGATIYRAVCQGCHMPDARGAQGAGGYPSLAANTRLASPAFAVARVLNGGLGMPRFADMLSDVQIAEVANYVRANFGNHYTDRLSVVDVEGMRAAVKSGGDK